MTFPTTPRGGRVELMIDGAWVDVTEAPSASEKGDVMADDIVITRGRGDGDATGQPSSCQFTLNNRLGKYSPRNPMSPYYNKIGRNTPCRVVIRQMPGPVFDAASNASAGTGNFSWTHTPVGKPTGVLVWLLQSGSTTFTTGITVTYGGVSVPFDGSGATNSGGQYYRFFLGHGLPAGPQTISITTSGGLTRRPVAVTVTGGTDVEINNVPAPTSGSTANPSMVLGTTEETLVLGLLHSGQDAVSGVAPGAGYTDVLEHDFGSDVMSVVRGTGVAAAGSVTLSWVATADTWTINDVALSAASYRFTGEVGSFPANLDDTTNQAAWVPMRVQAGGLGRRLGQGTPPNSGGLRAFYINSHPVTYWPLDDGPAAVKGAPAAGSYMGSTLHRALGYAVFSYGVGTLASYLPPTLRINDTTPSGVFDALYAECNGSDTTPDALAMEFVYKADQELILGGLPAYPAGFFQVELRTAASNHWQVKFRNDGVNNDIQLLLETVDFSTFVRTTTPLGDTVPLAAVTDTEFHHVRLSLTQNGANVDYQIHVDGASVLTGTHNSYTLLGVSAIEIQYDRTSNVTDALLCMGHLIVWENLANIPSIATTSLLAFGRAGEVAGRRIERLCGEEGLAFVSTGNLDDTTEMGLQYEDAFPAQLTECEATDMGLLYEPRYVLAQGYRTRRSMYTQDPVVTLTPARIASPLNPTDDDQQTRNDVFAQRREGSSFNATLESGAMSVLEPPDGVGRYKDEVQVNCLTDAMLEGIAGWLLALGTVDEARYPQITIDLADLDVAAVSDAVLAIMEGDRLAATGLQDLNIYTDLSQLVLGYTETIGVRTHKITYNCRPEATFAIAEYGTGVGSGPDRYDTAGSELASAVVSTTATSLSVKVSTDAIAGAATLWTTTAGEFPFDIDCGGERMTVTNITGSSSPQTFTVTRSVNGVVKTHVVGTTVRLWRTPRYGL